MTVSHARPSLHAALLCLTLALPLALAGCGGGGGGGEASSKPPSPGGPPVAPAIVTTPSGLTAFLYENVATTSAGGTVTYGLLLENVTSHPVTFSPVNPATVPAGTSASAVGGSLTITSPTGAVVYPPAGTAAGAGTAGPSTTLAPGETSVAGTVAPGSVLSAPGTYAATATFTLSSGSPATTQTTTVGPLNVTAQ